MKIQLYLNGLYWQDIEVKKDMLRTGHNLIVVAYYPGLDFSSRPNTVDAKFRITEQITREPCCTKWLALCNNPKVYVDFATGRLYARK